MRITKHEHATLELTKEGEVLVVDPGAFTAPLTGLSNVVGVVVTHNHPDHWTPDHLAALHDQFPDAPIYSTADVADAFGDAVTVVSAGQTVAAGSFSLEIFPSTHETIHSSIPLPINIGVLVDDTLYIPGDSYDAPSDRTIPVLAVPAGAPWLRIGDAMDFVLRVAPERAFYIHEAPLSKIGLGMHRARLAWATEQGGGSFTALSPGESFEI